MIPPHCSFHADAQGSLQQNQGAAVIRMPVWHGKKSLAL
jgi:hypothetical protein